MLPFAGYAAVVIVLLVGIVVGMAATKPDSYTVSRAIVIAAPPEKIAPLIVDFHHWAIWSPWEHLDPNMEKRFSGAPSGTGAIYQWNGNAKAGEGRMEILSATALCTGIQLEFIRPFPNTAQSDFVLAPVAGGTELTWSMTGAQKLFPSKVMSVFVTMDKMIGGDFESGLAALKGAAER